ncbi:MAG: hypothetical protein IJL26_07065, partial [Clostridia bacterium]|nr:hypothetical protein [Clostridia bacterium]
VLGEGDKAYEKLTELWNGGFITRNTMYSEGGNPVLETPCAAAAAVLDMLIQSNNGTISIFPALPKAWTDASVDSLACEGGFEVSAVYRGGRFLWADIRNPRSETGICRISIPPLENNDTTVFADHFERVITFPTAGLRLKIPKGQSVLLCGKDARDFELSPVTYSEDNCHVYGGHKDSMI